MSVPGGDWVHVYRSLFDHPKTRRLGKRLELDAAAAAGHLACLWTWAMAFAPDGDLSPFDDDEIAAAAGYSGDARTFIKAAAGSWIDRDESGGWHIHDWSDWAGPLVAKRARECQRSRDRRAAAAAQSSPSEPATDGRPMVDRRSTVGATDGRPPVEESREEKRREERALRPLSDENESDVLCGELVTTASDNGDGFDAFWAQYPRHEARLKAQRAWRRIAPDEQRLATGIATVMRDLLAKGVTEKRFVPHATTFIYGKRWDDWRDGVPASWCTAGAEQAEQAHAEHDDFLRRFAAERGLDYEPEPSP